MLKQPPGVRRLVLDPEILATCDPTDDLNTWRNKLRNGGVLREPLPGDEDQAKMVQALSQIQDRFMELEARAQDLAKARPEARERTLRAAMITLVLALVAVPVLGTLYGPGAAVAGTVLAAALFAFLLARKPPAPQVEVFGDVDRAWLHGAVQPLLAHSFVAEADGVVLENTPHRRFLLARMDDVGRAREQLEARMKELLHLRNGMVEANRGLGRDDEDDEVRAVDAELQRLEEHGRGLTSLRDDLDTKLEELEGGLEQLRLHANRRALSSRLGQMLADSPAEMALEAQARVEVDVLELEARFAELELELSDADARLRAALEVEASARS